MGVAFNPFTGDLQLLNASSSSISTVTTDPTNPSVGDIWILHPTGFVGGTSVGLLLSLTQTLVPGGYFLSYFVGNGVIIRTVLS